MARELPKLRDEDYRDIAPIINSEGLLILARHIERYADAVNTLSQIGGDAFSNGQACGIVRGLQQALLLISDARNEIRRRKAEAEKEKPDES